MPISSFFNPETDKSDKFKIPVEALIIFLDDKGIEPLVNLLKEMLINENTEFISNDDFLNIIYRLLNDTEMEQKPEIIMPDIKDEFIHEKTEEIIEEKDDFKELNDKLKGIGELSDLLNTTFSKIHTFRKESDELENIETEKEFNDFHDGEVMVNYEEAGDEMITEENNKETI